MAEEMEFEPMEQDADDGGETLQVQVTNDLFPNNDENEELIDFEAADDLEISDFTTPENKQEALRVPLQRNKALSENSVDGPARKGHSPIEQITISVVGADGNEAKEDGEISETQSQSETSDIDEDNANADRNSQYFSRSSSLRSSQRRNDIRRERSPVARQYPNPYLEFDDEKIQSRALRFGLSNSGTTSTTPVVDKPVQFSDEDLLNLYISCGLVPDDGGKLTLEKVAPHHRLDSILVRGTNHMNTNEIFKYLYDMGQKPVTMEWVNDAMCVVIYKDKYDAATSIMKTTKPIMMDPRLVERKRSVVQALEDDTKKEKEETTDEKSESMNEDFDYDKVDAIPQSRITVPMPPGYVWRLGAPCDKAKGILVRYANKQDKKQERAERFSEFYRNYGNPNKSGGRENDGRENMHRRKKIRHENQDSDRRDHNPSREPVIKMLNPKDKNGWGQLSAMWDDEEAFQNSARDRFTLVKQRSKDSESSSTGVSPLKRPEASKESTSSKTVDAREILKTRQKRKRGTHSSDEDEVSDNNSGDTDKFDNGWKDNGSFRRKRGSKVDDDDDDDNIAWRERLSAPRMRMHADEEEERMKKRAFRRLGGRKFEPSLQTNSWDFSRDSSSSNISVRTKTGSQPPRRPISERLGAKRYTERNDNGGDSGDLNDDSLEAHSGFDLRDKLTNMRRVANDEEDAGESDEDEDLQNLLFFDKD